MFAFISSNITLIFFFCSFASVVEPKGFPFSPGPTSASFAKSKTSYMIIFIILNKSKSEGNETVFIHHIFCFPSLYSLQACVFTVLQKGKSNTINQSLY